MKLSGTHQKILSGTALLALLGVAVSTVVFSAGGGAPTGGMGGAPGGTGGNLGQVELSESVITVKLTAPTVGDLSRNTEFIGKLEPAESVNVYPEVSAKVTQVYFEAGESVQKGDLLFELDDSEAQLSYQIAQASYDSRVISTETSLGSGYDSKLLSAKTQLENAQNSLNNARLKLADYNDGYGDSLTRAEKLRDQAYEKMQTAQAAYEANPSDDTLRQAYDDAETEYRVASANVNELEADEDSAARDLRTSYRNAQTSYQQALDNYNLLLNGSREDAEKAADADLVSAQLSVEQSASKLGKYKVYAPISGVIETRAVAQHESASTQTAAFTISNKETMTVKFNASSDAATALSIGDTITVQKGGNDYTATIIELSTKADGTTGLFPIKARLEQSDGSLLSGVTVKVTAATQKAEDALLVPNDAIYYEDGQAYVFTYADGKAHRTEITTGMSSSETVAVIDGLTEESAIITTWHPDLKEGATVQLAEGQTAVSAAPTVAKPTDVPGASDAAEGGAAALGRTFEDRSSKADAPAAPTHAAREAETK